MGWYKLRGWNNQWVKVTNDSEHILKIVYKDSGATVRLKHIAVGGNATGANVGLDFDYEQDHDIRSFYLLPNEFRDLNHGDFFITVLVCRPGADGNPAKYILEENLRIDGGQAVVFKINDRILPVLRLMREA